MARPKPERPKPTASTNAAAIEVTLAALMQMGRLEDVDAAKVQAVRSIAAALDEHPWNSQMWREYREAIEGLIGSDRNDDSSIDELLDELSSSVRNPSQT